MMLRDYQQRSIDQLYAWFEAGNAGHPCLVLPTGAGKSHIVAALCKDALQQWPETRILMLTHVKELIVQNAEKMRQHWPNAPLGIYSSGLRKKDIGEPITFAGIQSVRTKAEMIGHVDIAIIDECFVSGTKISTPSGLIDIDKMRCGQLVYNQCGVGVVESISCRPSFETYLIEFDNGYKTECTGNHRFFTSSGWKTARELEDGENLFSIEDMSMLWERFLSLDEKGWDKDISCDARTCLGKAEMLLRQVCEEITSDSFECNGSQKDKREAERNQAQAYKAWRERAIAAFATSCTSSRARGRMDCGVSNKYESGSSEWNLPKCVQGGYCESGHDDCNRNRRCISYNSGEERTRQKEDDVLGSVRVDRVSRIKYESPKLVFNLQVSGHPSYFANGVAVHNCHLVSHKDEGGYRSLLNDLIVINPQLRVIGLTATPYRLGHGYITDKPALFDALIEPVSIEELIYKGYLSRLKSKLTKTQYDVSEVHKKGGEYIESELQAAVDTHDKNVSVVQEIMRYGADRKSWLIFCSGVDHARHIKDVLVAFGITAECVTGDTPAKERDRMLAEFKLGRIKAMTNANVLTTGFDAPGIDLIAMLRPTMSPGLYVQMAGRGLRICEWKSDCLVLDFAGVVEQHGPITNVKPPAKKGDKVGEAPVKVCDNCQEIVHTSVKVCPACETPFPEPEQQPMMLSNLDIMGESGIEMEVTQWTWRKHISRTSGKEMLSCTLYGGLSDTPVTSYYAICHDGYAGQKSRKNLTSIAYQSGVSLDYSSADLCDIANQMSNGTPPTIVEYRKDGKYHTVLRLEW